MARILLVNPPMLDERGEFIDRYQGVRPKLPPLGLAYIGAVLENHGHEVKIIDGMVERFSCEQIGRIATSYDVVGITSTTFLALQAHILAKEIKRYNESLPVVMGGVHASVMPEEVLLDSNIDFVVVGEGENTFLELVETLGHKECVEHVSGIAFVKNGQLVSTPLRPLEEELDKFPLPARHLLPMPMYHSSEVRARRQPALHMVSSRGCPFNCSFCSCDLMYRRKLRLHSAERVVEEMCLLIKDYGAKEIHFWDDCFTFDEERVRKICELILKKRVKIFWDCEATVNKINLDLLKLMRRAGCFGISFGIECGSDQRLRQLNKGWLNCKLIEEAVSLARQVGLRTRGYFMFGFPGETIDDIEKTINFAKRLPLDFATFSILIPLPKTLDYERAKTEGRFDPYYWRHKIVSEISFPVEPVYVPEGIQPEELIRLHRKACREFYFRPHIILKRALEIYSLDGLKGNIKGFLSLLQKNY